MCSNFDFADNYFIKNLNKFFLCLQYSKNILPVSNLNNHKLSFTGNCNDKSTKNGNNPNSTDSYLVLQSL